MIRMKSFNPLGAILNMSNEAVNRLRRMISQGSEVERKLSAGVFRSIISDMITLYEENRKYRGKGILVFNPTEPTASKYCTIQDLEADLSIAQEAMSSDMEEMFHKVIKFVEKKVTLVLALVAFYERSPRTNASRSRARQ